MHDYVPDFLIRLDGGVQLILETKGFDEKAKVKESAAQRWVDAVNADGRFGTWRYAITYNPNEVPAIINRIAEGGRTNGEVT